MDEDPFNDISHPRKKAFLWALVDCGQVGRAAKAAGLHRGIIASKPWKEDQAFQDALTVAWAMFTENLEAEAVRRAIDGDRSYKFTKDGTALRHPETCVCGHEAREHLRDQQSQVRQAGRCASTGPVIGGGACDCEAFLGAPYYEDKRSDTMLIFTMKGMMPAKYGDRVTWRGALASYDVSKWTDAMISRLIAGEDPAEILKLSSEPLQLPAPAGEIVVEDATEPAPLVDDAGPEVGEGEEDGG